MQEEVDAVLEWVRDAVTNHDATQATEPEYPTKNTMRVQVKYPDGSWANLLITYEDGEAE